MADVINPYGTPQFNSSVLNPISPISTLKETDLLTTKDIEGVNAFATAKNSRFTSSFNFSFPKNSRGENL